MNENDTEDQKIIDQVDEISAREAAQRLRAWIWGAGSVLAVLMGALFYFGLRGVSGFIPLCAMEGLGVALGIIAIATFLWAVNPNEKEPIHVVPMVGAFFLLLLGVGMYSGVDANTCPSNSVNRDLRDLVKAFCKLHPKSCSGGK